MSFVRFANTDIVNDTARLTTSTWTNNINELTTVFTSSVQASIGSPTSSGAHYIDVYNANPQTDTTAEVQYSVAYGHRVGSGSLNFTNAAGAFGISPSRNIYSQYRQLVFGTENQNFNFTKTARFIEGVKLLLPWNKYTYPLLCLIVAYHESQNIKWFFKLIIEHLIWSTKKFDDQNLPKQTLRQIVNINDMDETLELRKGR